MTANMADDRRESLLAEALSCVARGWPVFPVHSVHGQICSCPKASSCDRSGKHPRTKNGLKDAVLDVEQVTAWWKKWPLANIGVRTGDGLMVLDVDKPDSLGELEELHEKLPVTPMALTGGGGSHHWFRYSGELANSVAHVASGIDVRADGGYVVVPPSSHASGRYYAWEFSHLPGEVAIAQCPEWLLKLARKKRSSAGAGHDGATAERIIGEGRNNYLMSIAGFMRRKGTVEGAILAALIEQNRAKCYPPLDEAEVRRVAQSVLRYPPVEEASTELLGELELWLKKNKSGFATKDPGNAALHLQHNPEWQGILGFNELTCRAEFIKGGPKLDGFVEPKIGEPLADRHIIYIQHWLSIHVGPAYTITTVAMAVESASFANSFHPIRDWLDSLTWDGTARVHNWCTTYLGVKETDYSKSVGSSWLLSAVARVMKPGCQADHVLVLEGKQGTGKSTAMEALCGKEWYLPTLPDIRNKDAVQALSGHWICEIAELDAFKGSSATRVKDFVSQRIDDFRPSYGRFNVVRPRQIVFVATTNEHEWMADSTGGRRFWPLRVTNIDRDGILRDRDQLWAEAYAWYLEGKTWYPTNENVAQYEAEQEDRFQPDPWEEIIRQQYTGHPKLVINDILCGLLTVPVKDLQRGDQMRVGSILRRMGYTRRRVYDGSTRCWVYEKD